MFLMVKVDRVIDRNGISAGGDTDKCNSASGKFGQNGSKNCTNGDSAKNGTFCKDDAKDGTRQSNLNLGDQKGDTDKYQDPSVVKKKQEECSRLSKKFGFIFGGKDTGDADGAKGDSKGKSAKESAQNLTIKQLVGDALSLYNADKTGKTDFAVETAGGSIASIRNTENYHKDTFSFLGLGLCENGNGPRAMIQPSVNPGECWSFRGSSGAAVIKLVGLVFLSGVTVEHIPKEISPTGNISSAPREMSVWGLGDPDDRDGCRLGQFVYDDKGPSVQYFEIEKLKKPFQFVEVKIHSNHGNELYTCVYRVRVHGTLERMESKGRRV